MPLMNESIFEQAEQQLDQLFFEVDSHPLFYQNTGINKLIPQYSNELGQNAYAALNIISDLTSHQIIDPNKFESSSQMQDFHQIPIKWLSLHSRRDSHLNPISDWEQKEAQELELDSQERMKHLNRGSKPQAGS